MYLTESVGACSFMTNRCITLKLNLVSFRFGEVSLVKIGCTAGY